MALSQKLTQHLESEVGGLSVLGRLWGLGDFSVGWTAGPSGVLPVFVWWSWHWSLVSSTCIRLWVSWEQPLTDDFALWRFLGRGCRESVVWVFSVACPSDTSGKWLAKIENEIEQLGWWPVTWFPPVVSEGWRKSHPECFLAAVTSNWGKFCFESTLRIDVGSWF